MTAQDTVTTDRLSEAEVNLAVMKSNIERLKALGMDTSALKQTYDFLSKQIGLLKNQ